ncbi:hypothetical protein [Paenalcaligenes hermetiae]|uniref:hypothetical protein n=1 Tax=Paenalcaligenes hermetiae TaxID=1157987 RepID=UPI0031ECAD4A
MRETVSVLEQRGYIEYGGVGRGTYWGTHPDLYNRLSDDDQGEARRRIVLFFAVGMILHDDP